MSKVALAPAVQAQQAKAYFEWQGELIDGVAEGNARSEVDSVLGGLGTEKTLQIVEERALQGKCGNVLCVNPVTEDHRNYKHDKAVKILSNGDVVKAQELDEFCSEDCFMFFKRKIVPKRPVTDSWELQKILIARANKAKGNAVATSDESAAPKTGLVGQIKEKEVVAKPKKKFSTAPSPDGETVLLAEKIEGKNVSFEDERSREDDQVSVDENSNVTENADDQDEDEEEEELTMSSFLDMSLKPDDKIENAGLSSFVLVWDLLTRVATDFSRQAIFGRELLHWKTIAIPETELNDRRAELLAFLMEGVDVCNFSASDDFAQEAKAELARLVPTFDLSRNVPKFTLDPWVLATCVILGALAEAGRFPKYDFERSDIVKCFPPGELNTLDHDQMEMLKGVLRIVPGPGSSKSS